MSSNNILLLACVGIAGVALIIFLIWKNNKDKKELNPDASDAMDEIRKKQELDRDRI